MRLGIPVGRSEVIKVVAKYALGNFLLVKYDYRSCYLVIDSSMKGEVAAASPSFAWVSATAL